MMVPFEVQSPCLLPQHLRVHGALLQVCGEDQHIVPAAIQKGIWLSKAQLEALHSLESFKGVPSKKVYKADLAKACIMHYFKDVDPDSDAFSAMFESMMGRKQPAVDQKVLDAIDALDPIAQEDFAEMKKVARNQRQAQTRKKAATDATPKKNSVDEAATCDQDTEKDVSIPEAGIPQPESPPEIPSASGVKRPGLFPEPDPETGDVEPAVKQLRSASAGNYDKKVYTPHSLQELLPGKGTLPGVYIKRLPTVAAGTESQPEKTTSTGCYQGFYPGRGLPRLSASVAFLSCLCPCFCCGLDCSRRAQ